MTATRDRLLVSFAGLSLRPAEAEAIAGRAAGVTLYRHVNVESPEQVRGLTDALQAAVRRLRLPSLLIAADHETGQLHAMGDGATPFAGAMALGAVGDEGLAERVAAAIGAELRAMGVTVVYAPDCDLATNPRNPVVGIRSFGDDPAAVGRLAAATVRGLQSAGVAATVKHLPGHGDTTGDSHHGLAVVSRSREELTERELVPFRATIAAGARLTMAGHLAVPALTGRHDLPATLSAAILRDLLRDELGFDGLTVSDALDMGAITGGTADGVDVGAALAAGTDLLLCGPDPAAQAWVEAGLASVAASDAIDPASAAASARRLADLRAWLASFETPPLEVVASRTHLDLADELARRSITLIRDRDRLLPIEPRDGARVLVIEPRPRDLTPADTTSWLPAGGLAAVLAERLGGVERHLVDAEIDATEIASLRSRAERADLVVVGTVDALGRPSVVELVRSLVATRPVVAVALRGPWDADAYPEAGTVLATYGIQSPSLRALATALVGDVPISARLPVRLQGAPRDGAV